MQKEDSVDHICLVDNIDATDDHFFDKSMQELRNFSSHLYQTAQYCESTFLAAEDKTIILENTKQCISRAVVEVVEHLGSISADLESSLSTKTTSIPQTNTKINFLKMRIEKCLQQSHKLALDRIYLAADFSNRHHSRYILPPSTDLAASNGVSRDSKDGIEAKTEKEDEFETEEPLFLHTHNCKPYNSNSTRDMGYQNKAFSPPVLPVREDVLSLTLPKSEQPVFQFKEARKAKRSAINWRAHGREMASLVRRGKRILA